MPVRVLARRIELVMMMRMLDRTHAIAAGRQVPYQVHDQRRFAAVLSTDDMNAFQLPLPWVIWLVPSLRFVGFVKGISTARHPLT